MRQTILVAGGGIGGLAAALSIAQAGFDVRVFEAAVDPAETGAALQLGANGMKALRSLGLEEAVLPFASRPSHLELKLPGSGRVVSRVPLGAAHLARYGAPYIHIHRADLHGVLLQAARRNARIEILTGRRVTRVGHTHHDITIHAEDGTEAEGAALIGADGIHSVVRDGVAGHDEPRFTGMLAWRTLVPATPAELAVPPSVSVWMGPGRHLVVYPLRARGVVNLVGVVERADWTGESWTEAGNPADMRADFGGWHASTDSLLDRVETPFRWALHERAPLSTWCAGRVALLGDAAHAMPPFLAQGAAMALEDAVVLGRRLSHRPDDLTHALRDYSEARHARTARVQRASWANAWRFHLRHPAMRFAVYGTLGAISRVAPSRPMKMFDWLYDHDPANV